MKKHYLYKKIFLISIMFSVSIFSLNVSNTEGIGMDSQTYQITTDSLNSGGLDSSNSTNYGLLDTVGELATGPSESTNYKIFAGYRQLQSSYISISAESDTTISSINGLSGGIGTGSSTWTVITDNLAGYELTVRSATDPALTSGPYFFDDYTPSGPAPDFNFSFDTTESLLGFSPEGPHIVQKYKDNGSACNAGSLDTSMKCWEGFSTNDELIARSYSQNHPDGTETTLQYTAAIGSEKIQENGDYSMDLILTATAL